MKFTNYKMMLNVQKMEDFLSRTDIIGYACAVNTAKFKTVLEPFMQLRDNLVAQYGTDEKDENGKLTGRSVIPMDTPEFNKFKEEIDKLGNIEHDVDIYTIPSEIVIDKLSGEDILSIIWMLEN